MKKIALVAMLLLPFNAIAQTVPQPSPREQALAMQLNQRINEVIEMQTQLIAAARAIEADKAKIADLERKPSDTPPPAKKE